AQFQVRFSLQWQFLLMVSLFTVVLAGVPSLALLDFTQKRLLEEMDQRAALLLDALVGVAADAIVQEDPLALNDAIQRYIVLDDIQNISVFDDNNRVLFYADGEAVLTHAAVLQNPSLAARLLESPVAAAVFASNRALWRGHRYFNQPLKPMKCVETAPATGRTGLLYDYSLPITHASAAIQKQLGTLRVSFSTRRVFESLERTRRRMGYGLGGLLVLALAGTFLLSRQITVPILRLARDVQTVAAGDLSHRIQVSSRDEIGLLASEFNLMTTALSQAQKALVARALVQRDLELAAQIQASLIPSGTIRRGGLSVAGRSIPAREMGGDYFDVMEIDAKRTAVVVSDVSGKGVSAALIMVMLKSALQTAVASGTRDPARLCALTNRLLHRQTSPDKYATLHIAVIDGESGEAVFTNAGHGVLRIYRRSEDLFEEHLVPAIPLGMSSETAFNQESFRLSPGDFICFYTDGLTECRDASGDRYGWGRLSAYLRAHRDAGAPELVEGILRHHDEFRGEREVTDDLTIVVARFDPPAISV
ncbi:MAG: SpoIIE family protein phosphatase, partial [Spirochaetes bacterium]|nr:SpoIIE family protein phosphatase [Spirochaetota bacterium]